MLQVKWLIQDVGMKVSQIYLKYDALQFLGEEVANIGVIANYEYISGLSEAINEDINTKYVFLAGVKALNLLRKANHISDVIEFPTEFQINNSDQLLSNLISGFFYDFQNFDQQYYGKLDLPLINHEAEYIPLKECLQTTFNVDKFIKPSTDLKAFDAGILPFGNTIESFVLSKPRQRFFMEETLVISNVIKIKEEYRFFVVNGKVISGSAYRLNYIVEINSVVPENIVNIAQEFADLYHPSDIFTLDLAVTEDDQIRIVEYNCFNCSGVYLCDMTKVFKAIKEYILNK